MPEHKSSVPRTGCRLFYSGIYADAAKILCHQEPTSYDVEQQLFAVSQHGTRATRDDQGMGCEAAEGTQCRERNEMAVFYTSNTTSEWLRRILSEEYQDFPEKRNRRASTNTL